MSTPTASPVDTGASAAPVKATTPWTVEHAPFLLALLVAAALRVLVQVAYTPALVFSDGPLYLQFLETFDTSTDRPVGYGLLLLYPVSWFTDNLAAVAAAQHVMGLMTAGLLYTLLRRWNVGRWVATLACLPVLFDAMELLLEHATHSDTFFDFLLVAAMTVLGWRHRPTPAFALAGGVLLGVCVTVRLAGEPLVIAGIIFCLVSVAGWRRRLATAAALTLGFLVPVGAYATWYHAEHGVFALAEFDGTSLYLRTTSFVDCAELSVPSYQEVLCPREPLGERLEPTFYVWHDERTLPRLRPPPGTTVDEALHEFAVAAIRAQPLDYARIVVRDFALNFGWERDDSYEFDTADKWQFERYLDFVPAEKTVAAYENNGGELLTPHQPYADILIDYQKHGYLPGPLLLGCLLLGLLGALGIGRARDSGMRAMCLLLTASGTGLMLVPAVAAEFVWRYQLPALLLLPAAAALAFTAIRGGQRDATRATPRID